MPQNMVGPMREGQGTATLCLRKAAYDDCGNVVAQWSDKTNRMEMVGEPVGRYVPRKLGSQFLHE